MTTEVVDEYVSERLKYFKKLKAEADALIADKRSRLRLGEAITLSKEELAIVALPNQVMQELAYGLDEAMAALKFYASADTWKEVPDHTYAAQDVGMKARVALARINPV